MAGLFNSIFNYSKPGPGVTANEPEKKPFFKFWELFLRKFWQLISVNLIFLLCLVPFAVVSYLILSLLRTSAWSVTDNLQLAVIFSLSPLMFCGPFIGGLQKITRDFAREEPVFIWSDFFKAVKNNYKQTMIMSVLAYIIFSSLSVALPSYYYSNTGFIKYIIFGLCLLCGIVFLFMQFYIYTMSVTFKLTLKQIYKNAAILSTVTIVTNFIITFVLVVYAALVACVFLISSSFSFIFVLGILFFVTIGFSFLSFVISFLTFPLLKKYIIDPYYNSHPKETSSALNLKDKDEKKELPEYVYYNGKMVHRSVLEKETLFQDSQNKKPK